MLTNKENTHKRPAVAPSLPNTKGPNALEILLQVPTMNSEGVGSKEYFIDYSKLLGKGSFGSVYKACLLGKDNYPDLQ